MIYNVTFALKLHENCEDYRKHCEEVCDFNSCYNDIHTHVTQWFCKPCYAWLIGDKNYQQDN